MQKCKCETKGQLDKKKKVYLSCSSRFASPVCHPHSHIWRINNAFLCNGIPEISNHPEIHFIRDRFVGEVVLAGHSKSHVRSSHNLIVVLQNNLFI
jgi:hypothetical protein